MIRKNNHAFKNTNKKLIKLNWKIKNQSFLLSEISFDVASKQTEDINESYATSEPR